ncbi:MAG: 3-phosphoshikimate 1-carboxyvinyltransferase [Candidatus Dormibacteria bacterium]|jgi:3-phosphoshikimate 1-carboxyvinyltransferase
MTTLGGSATLGRQQGPLLGRCQVPSDKSISHRAAILAACSTGRSEILNFSAAGDCRASLNLVRSLGCDARLDGTRLEITGLGRSAVSRRLGAPLDCERSGTTMRLGAGLAAGLPWTLRLTGHPQLLRRPMERVAEPLRRMGARVTTAPGGRPPIDISGGDLTGIEYVLDPSSAQVKSAVLIAGLYASSPTTVVEPIPTRDHTERMLAAMGASIEGADSDRGRSIRVAPGTLSPLRLSIPGDASSASVLGAAAALVPGSDVVLERVSANPTRTRFFEVLARMGAVVEFDTGGDQPGPEPATDIRVRQGALSAVRIEADEVPLLIDELPLVGLLATAAEGVTEVRGAAELRTKESDRIAGLVSGLRALGADAEELADGFVVRGPTQLRGGACDALTDHRLAMTFTLAGLVSAGVVEVTGSQFVSDSFPGFFASLRELSA